MTYGAREISNFDGRPVCLYEFTFGNTVWRYCTADEDLILNDLTYIATAIKDDGMTQGSNDQNDFQVTCPDDLPVAQLFRTSRPSGKVHLTTRHWHVGDDETEIPIYWIGTVTNSVIPDRATAVLHCRAISSTYDRNGLRLPWSRTCTVPLYGIGCYVDKVPHGYEYTIATVDGQFFTLDVVGWSDPVEGSFAGGFLEWNREDGSQERRGIEKQVGNDFRIFGSTDGMSVGQGVTLYPGCDRSTTNCIRFANLKNYPGFPQLPGKSPFDGTPIF